MVWESRVALGVTSFLELCLVTVKVGVILLYPSLFCNLANQQIRFEVCDENVIKVLNEPCNTYYLMYIEHELEYNDYD